MRFSRRVMAIDSHTGGEPTRIVVAGGPDLGGGTVAEQCRRFRADHDRFRSFVVNEPRGSDVVVGGLLVPPSDPRCIAGIVFFNNVSTLGMCGHGTIGLLVTLRQLGRVTAGEHLIETPVGVVTATLHDDHTVSVQNVPSYRHAANVSVHVDGLGWVTGDVAWGGNWFFLVNEHRESIARANVERLTDVTWRIRQALTNAKITGADGGEIDHIELFGEPGDAANDSRNFVLCPGKAYDRSPCGTGTSAKLACLVADGKLKRGNTWRQESILGSVFEGSYELDGERIVPTIRGRAYISAELTLLAEHEDPFADGIQSR
jgi:4-hydroxyproline epimerase